MAPRKKKTVFGTVQDAIEYMRKHLRLGNTEQAIVLYVNNNELIEHEIFDGLAGSVDLNGMMVARKAVLLGAGEVICAHTHPSGVCAPSSADVSHTKELRDTLRSVGVGLMDDIILTRDRSFSVRAMVCLEDVPLFSYHEGLADMILLMSKWILDRDDAPGAIRGYAEQLRVTSEELLQQVRVAELISPLQAGQ